MVALLVTRDEGQVTLKQIVLVSLAYHHAAVFVAVPNAPPYARPGEPPRL